MLAEKLVEQYGASSVFLDIDNVPLGVDFRHHLDSAVARCDILLALIGDSWLESKHDDGTRRLDDPGDFVRIEIEAALNRNIAVIPVLAGNARMPLQKELPQSMGAFAYRNASELRSGKDLRSHIDRLLAGLNAHLNQVPNQPKESNRTQPHLSETPKQPKEKPSVVKSPSRASLESFIKHALLLYEPKRSVARIFRMLFLTGFAISTLLTCLMITVVWTDEKYGWDVLLGSVCMFWLPLYLLAWLPAFALDKRQSRKADQTKTYDGS
jgi:hypothetical protein